MKKRQSQSASAQSIDQDDTDIGGPSNVWSIFSSRNKQETKVSANNTNGQPTRTNDSEVLNDPPNKIRSVPKFFKQKSNASNLNEASNKDSSIKNVFRSKSKTSKSVLNISSKDFENETEPTVKTKSSSYRKLNKLVSEPGYELNFLKKISLRLQGLKKNEKQKLGNKCDSVTSNEQDPTDYETSDACKSKKEDFGDECVENTEDVESGFLRHRKGQMSMRKAFGIFEDFENQDINSSNDVTSGNLSEEVIPEVWPDICGNGKPAVLDDDTNKTCNKLDYFNYDKQAETSMAVNAGRASLVCSKDYWNGIETNGTKFPVKSECDIASIAVPGGTSDVDDNPDVHSTLKPDAYANQLRQQARKLSFSKGSGLSFSKKNNIGHDAKVKYYNDQSSVGELENISNTEHKDLNNIDVDILQGLNSFNDTRIGSTSVGIQISKSSPAVADSKFHVHDVVIQKNSFYEQEKFDAPVFDPGQNKLTWQYVSRSEKVFEMRDGLGVTNSYSNQQQLIYKPDDQKNNLDGLWRQDSQSSAHQEFVDDLGCTSNSLVLNNQQVRSTSDHQSKRMPSDNDTFESSQSDVRQGMRVVRDPQNDKNRTNDVDMSQFSIGSGADSGHQKADHSYNRGMLACKSLTLDRMSDLSLVSDESKDLPMSPNRPSFLIKKFKPVKFSVNSSYEEKDGQFLRDFHRSETTDDSSKNCDCSNISQTPVSNYTEPHVRTKSVGASVLPYQSPIKEGATNLRSRTKSESRLVFLQKQRHSQISRSFDERDVVTRRGLLPKRKKHAEEDDCDDFAIMFARKWMTFDSNLSNILLTKYKTALDYVPSLTCVSYTFNEDYSRSLNRDSDKKKEVQDYYQQPAKSTKNCFVTLDQEKIDMENKLVKKLDILNDERISVEKKIFTNDELGGKVLNALSEHLDGKQVEKFESLVQEEEGVLKLLLKLSNMLTRTEESFSSLPHNSTDREKAMLHNKTEGLKLRLSEAKQIKENVDNKYEQLLPLFHALLPSSELKSLDTFFINKCLLMLEQEELDNNISLAQKQLQSLRCTMNKNSVGSYC